MGMFGKIMFHMLRIMSIICVHIGITTFITSYVLIAERLLTTQR